MNSMNISLPGPMREWVQKRIDGGQYASASDYVRDLIRRDQETERQLSIADIKRSIEESRARGVTIPAEAVFERIEARLQALAK